jgi:hypothetical protein
MSPLPIGGGDLGAEYREDCEQGSLTLATAVIAPAITFSKDLLRHVAPETRRLLLLPFQSP